jgi:hypothetical protein
MMDNLTDQQLYDAAECLKVMAHPAAQDGQILMREFPVNEIASACGISANQTCEHLH